MGLLSNNPTPAMDANGHLNDEAALELRRLILGGDRLAITVQWVNARGAAQAPSLLLPDETKRQAHALRDLADVLDPVTPAPGREEPLEAPELADTLADAYEAATEEEPDSYAEATAREKRADDLLAALGAVLASAYLEGRRRA